jgi:SAM-dependent methyltransferase
VQACDAAATIGVVPQNLFVGPIATGYDAASAEMYEPGGLAATVDFLATAARGGKALEFGIGTGRVALPLSQRGVQVHGIDISADMLQLLHCKPGSNAINTTVGDFAEMTVGNDFSLVYVVFNSISNLLEQSEWVESFRNAARHLASGGCFVVELWIPDLRRFPPGAAALPFQITPHHLGFDTLDIATQHGTSHHYLFVDGQVARFDSPFRYAWPAELDLMADLAGMRRRERWGDWDRSPYTSESPKHISVWQRT